MVTSTADFGVGAKGKFTNGDYHVLLSNGTGYGAVESSHKKEFQTRVSVMPGRTVRLSFYGDAGGEAGLKYISYGILVNRPVGNFSWGASYMANRKNTTAGGTVTKRQLYSLYSSYDFPKSRWSIFGRYDNYDPAKSASGDNQTLSLFGIAYKIDNNTRAIFSNEHLTNKGANTKDNALKATVEVGF